MGLFSFIKGQFIEVIEWLDPDADTMVYRFPAYDNAIKMGAKLIVRESQAAVFVNEGQIADVYGPGTHTLTTQNMPVLTALKSWPHLFESPFKADVFFVSTANFTHLKWGTTNPIMLRDPELGAIRLRGFGSYAIRVSDPALLLRELIGTRSDFSTERIADFLKSTLVTGISDLIGESRISAFDLASSYEELGASAMERLQPRLQAMGLTLSALLIENLSLPEEVEKMIDRRSSMSIAGNLDAYMKYQTAEAVREAANNPGSDTAGLGAGLGAGVAMGQLMGQMASQMLDANAASAQAAREQAASASGGAGGADGAGGAAAGADDAGGPSGAKRFCSECGERLAERAKFCSGCGTKV